MKTKTLNNIMMPLRYLLFLPFLFFTFCQQSEKVITISPNLELTKDSKVISLMEEAITVAPKSFAKKSDDDSNDDSSNSEACVEFQYPIAFYAIFPTSQSIETIVVNNDEELFNFFDALTVTDEIAIDFPMVLLGTDGEETTVNSLTELEETLEIVVDACRGNDDYEYCHDNNKKVYICHNGNTICVSINAIKAHLDHGDELGECDDDDDGSDD